MSRLPQENNGAGSSSSSSITYRVQLENDIQKLQKQLQIEIELHAILENAIEENTANMSNLPWLPCQARELLSSTNALEATVLQLEQKLISLNFQLSQERNERKLAEYYQRHSSSRSPVMCSDSMKALDMMDASICTEVDGLSSVKDGKNSQLLDAVELPRKLDPKGLWVHPCNLSEEMVRCMRKIFISLGDSAALKSLSCNNYLLSPHGHLSNVSPRSLTESSVTSSSWLSQFDSSSASPQVELQNDADVLAVDNSYDPYRVDGKLSWVDIGSYRLATEVSWMSVGKDKMEYAASALRRFRSLVEQLAHVNPIHLGSNEKLAFWVNLYNALIMHAYLAYGVPRSDLKLFSLMQKAAYTVGGHSFSANVIEYVILKMNSPAHRPQIALLLALRKLKVSEEQRKFAVEKFEPLVAFALSYGMYSSPAVRVYSAKYVREELQEAQHDFIRASIGMSSKGKLLVPKMLHCYAKSFVDDTKLAVWISHFLPPVQAAFVERCVSQRRQSLLNSRNCGVLPFDSRFRYLFLPEVTGV